MSSSPSPTVKQLVKINWLLSVVTTSSRLLLCHTFILDPKSAPTAPALHWQMLLEVLSVVLWQIISNSCMSHWSRNPEKNPHAHLMRELHVNNHRLQPLCFVAGQSLCWAYCRGSEVAAPISTKLRTQNLVREALILYSRRTPPPPFQCWPTAGRCKHKNFAPQKIKEYLLSPRSKEMWLQSHESNLAKAKLFSV